MTQISTIAFAFCYYFAGLTIVHYLLVKYNCLWLWRFFVIIVLPIAWLLELMNWSSEKLNFSFGQIFYYSKNENEIHLSASYKSKKILKTQGTAKERLDYLVKSVAEVSDILKSSVKIHTHGYMFKNEYLNYDWIKAEPKEDKLNIRKLHYLAFEMMHKKLPKLMTEEYYNRHRQREDWIFTLDMQKQ